MKLVMVRRVVGESMLPALRPGQLVIASGWFRGIRPGQVVIVAHSGLEKIKRVEQVDNNRRRIYITGDNPKSSTDSRHFGWLPIAAVVAVICWPRA